MNNKFSENLKKIRKENNLSQEQLADELGVSRQAISKWESAVAYPEMDKIIALCDKFNLNIDDLLHKDIKEVKGEEESKKKINNYIDDFLNFITNSINFFSNMNFKSKIKCLFEQICIAVLLLIASSIIYFVLDSLFNNIVSFLPSKIFYFVTNILDSILLVALLIISIILLAHIFKIRYLDYYDKVKKESIKESDNEKENNDEEKISLKKEDKIIIRDPKHSEYRFIKGLLKIIVYVIKFFALLMVLFLAGILVFLFCLLVASFLISKTGIFFIGIIISILSSSLIVVLLLLLLLNFIFNRNNNKKKMIICFISSLILLGVGVGLSFCGSLNFKLYDDDTSMLITKTSTFEMNNNLKIYDYYDEVNYIVSDNNDVKVEYKVNKICNASEYLSSDNTINIYSNCDDYIRVSKELLNNLNNKMIVPISERIYEVNVYSNKKNIEIIKNNVQKEIDESKKHDEERNELESVIEELQIENNKLRDELSEIKNDINN